MILWLFLATSQAEDELAPSEVWSQLNEARVMASTEVNFGKAIQRYKSLLKSVPKDQAIHHEILYFKWKEYDTNFIFFSSIFFVASPFEWIFIRFFSKVTKAK